MTFAGLVLAASLVGGVAWATTPSDGVTIHGCAATKTGALRVVANAADCKKNEFSISWDQKGQPGQAGATGANGTNGKDGTNGTDGAKGDKGDTGATGPAGAVATHTTRLSSSNGGPATVYCLENEQVTGGGAFGNGTGAAVHYPVDALGNALFAQGTSARGWQALKPPQSSFVTAYVFCAS